MLIYIPKPMDVYNSHLKNLVNAYVKNNGNEIILGYDSFAYGNVIPDLIHFHMVEGLLNFLNHDFNLFFFKISYYKSHNVKLIYTVHDLFPHAKQNNVNYQEFYDKFFLEIDVFVHHGDQSVKILKNTFKIVIESKHIVCPHGDYSSDMKNFTESKNKAREELGLSAKMKIILVFGQIQHKNLSFAKKVFNKYRHVNSKSFLIVAGVNPVFRYDSVNRLFYKINNHVINRFRLKRLFIYKRFSNHELYLLFKAADLVFLPHSYGMTSGLIPMCATLSVPFIYPNIGCFADQSLNTLSLPYEVNNIDDAKNSICKILKNDNQNFNNMIWLNNNTWEIHVERIFQSLKET